MVKINKELVESHLGKKVEVKLFYGEIITGYLHKTGEEKYKTNPGLYLRKNYYFLEYDSYDNFGNKQHTSLFRSSHITRIKEVD